MSGIEPFTSEMLERNFREHEVLANRFDDGPYRFQYEYSEDCDCELSYSIVAPTDEYRCLDIRGRSDKFFPAHRRATVLDWIDEFHRNRRMPLVYIREQGRRLRIETATIVDFSAGTHAALLSETIACFCSCTFDFWRFVAEKDR
ncbi:MAG: hypothetical protein ACKO5K_07720 [Armatimonadota bacterium]